MMIRVFQMRDGFSKCPPFGKSEKTISLMSWNEVRYFSAIPRTDKDNSLPCLRGSKISGIIQVKRDCISTFTKDVDDVIKRASRQFVTG